MKRAAVLIAFLGCIAFAGVVCAQATEGEAKESEKTPEKPDQKPKRERADRQTYGEMGRIMREKDADSDNRLSASEFGDADAFKLLDGDEDGFLTMQELVAGAATVNASIEKQAKAVLEEEFKILDRDDSGKLNKEELGNDFARLLETGDKNEDHELDFSEWTASRKRGDPAREDRAPGGRDGILARIDKDGDGKISKEEAPDRLKENFDKLDKNSDGFLTVDELKSARTNRGARNPQGGDKKPEGEQKPRDDKPAEDKPAEDKPADGSREEEF